MTLHEFNTLPEVDIKNALFNCCGSTKWVNKMLPLFPFDDLIELLNDAEEKWNECTEVDFLEAFTHHPKIGDVSSLTKKFAATAQWAAGEQSGANEASEKIINDLADGNKAYEKKFGFIFIVCATGKSAQEMLDMLTNRLGNNKATELAIAAAEQMKITNLRIQKLLA